MRQFVTLSSSERIFWASVPLYSPSACLQTFCGLFLFSLDVTLTLRLRHLTNHFLSPVFILPNYFSHSLCPSLLYYHLALHSLKLILSPGFVISNLSHIPLILLPHSCGFPVLPEILCWVLFQFPCFDLRKRLEVGRHHRPGCRDTWTEVVKPVWEWAVA